MRVNVSKVGRAASIIAGAALIFYGQRNRQAVNNTTTAAGLALISRGIAGWCPVVAATNGLTSRPPMGPNFGLS